MDANYDYSPAPVTEVANLRTDPDKVAQFQQVIKDHIGLVTQTPGCHGARLLSGVESPGWFILLIGWDSVEAHNGFRQSERFTAWRAAIGPFFATDPTIEHFADFGFSPATSVAGE